MLDTHVWMWWLNDDPRLTPRLVEVIEAHESDDLVVSAISCWEGAQKAYVGKLQLNAPPNEWVDTALAAPGIRVEPVSAEIAVESVLLPGELHKDPADRIIVATARVLDCPLLTLDDKLLKYRHVKHA